VPKIWGKFFTAVAICLVPSLAWAQTPYPEPKCTANDANIVAIADQTFSLSDQCIGPSDIATVRYNVTYTQNANSRYDILLGMIYEDNVVIQDFFSDLRVAGEDPFEDLDGEADKGDMSSTGAISPVVIVDMDIPCDLDNNGQIDARIAMNFIVGYNASKSGSGLPSVIEGPKCAISNQVILSTTTSLMLRKIVRNDEAEPGNKDVSFFDITTSAGALNFDSGTTTGTDTVYQADALLALTPGSYSFSETASPEYSEGSWSCDEGTVTSTAFDNGSIDLALGDQATCTIINDDFAFASLVTDKPDPSLSDMDGSGNASQGDVLTYRVTATNDGTVTQQDVVVTDPLISPSSVTCPLVAPGETCELVGIYTIAPEDFDVGAILNEASGQSNQVTTPVTVTHNFILPTRLTGSKTLAVYDPDDEGLYALPGEDVLYTLSIANPGMGETDLDSIVLIDAMPPEIAYYNGDIDGDGPESGSIVFSQADGSTLTFNESTDLAFSNNASKPANFSECTYSPAEGYDPDVTFVCFNPKGVLTFGDPDPNFSFTFRTKIL